MQTFNLNKKPLYILAPMDEVTDTVFRQIVLSCARPDLMMSEFVNVDALTSQGREKVINKLRISGSETNLIAQIWGLKPENFYIIAKQIADGKIANYFNSKTNFKGVDLNMGCPQKHEVNSGACIALINNRNLAKEIIKSTKKGLNNKLPLSIKTRIGFNNIDLSWIEFLLKQNIAMLTIHGRTKKEKSNSLVHWDIIHEARKLRDKISPNTLIVGNGDIKSITEGKQKIKVYNLDGIMIGRGVLDNPYLFNENNNWEISTYIEKLQLYKKHLILYKKTWPNATKVAKLNKYCKVYINNFYGAKELREQIMKCSDIDEKIKLINQELSSDKLVEI